MNNHFHVITELDTQLDSLTAGSVAGSKSGVARPERGKGMERILILDGNTTSALAATRSLGRKGVPVVVADESKRTLSGASRYCSESFTYPSPKKNLRAFLSTVKAECSQRGIRVIFPTTEVSTATVLKHREEFEEFELPFVEVSAFDSITDKWNLLGLARRLNITIPQTHYIADARALERVYATLRFPVVLKPTRSMIWTNGDCTAASVKYAESCANWKGPWRNTSTLNGTRSCCRNTFLGKPTESLRFITKASWSPLLLIGACGKSAIWRSQRALRERGEEPRSMEDGENSSGLHGLARRGHGGVQSYR